MNELIVCKVADHLNSYGSYGPGDVVEVTPQEAALQVREGNLMIIDKNDAEKIKAKKQNDPAFIIRQQEAELKAMKADKAKREADEVARQKEFDAIKAENEKLKKGGK